MSIFDSIGYEISLKDGHVLVTIDRVDNYQHAFYLYYPGGAERHFYSDSNLCKFDYKIVEGKYTAIFFLLNKKNNHKYVREEKFLITRQNNQFKIITEEEQKKLDAQKAKEKATALNPAPTNPIESNKLLLKMLSEKDNDLIRFTSELGLLKTKLQAKIKELELRNKELVKLKSALQESEKSLLAKSNQVVELIDRNELVESHLKNVQANLAKKEQTLSKIKAEFEILKGQLKSTL
ncbi:hypothetical protein AB9G26_09120 [Francisella philomiragia]|uniref:hypothetical protein n=1 Tax=Francisella philomiragia TaxID=28110 RepID=UPI0035182084